MVVTITGFAAISRLCAASAALDGMNINVASYVFLVTTNFNEVAVDGHLTTRSGIPRFGRVWLISCGRAGSMRGRLVWVARTVARRMW